MTNLQILKKLLDDYSRAEHETKDMDYLNYIQYLNSRAMSAGICAYISHNIIYIHNFYWIKRNIDSISPGLGWWTHPCAIHHKNISKRVQILKKEYDHHYKWRFIPFAARILKP